MVPFRVGHANLIETTSTVLLKSYLTFRICVFWKPLTLLIVTNLKIKNKNVLEDIYIF